jgi:uncharacterized membrane protein YedE/YeeE
MAIFFLAAGVCFGFVLSRSGAADYNFIQGMFLFTNFQLYGIIGTAVVLTAPGLWWIQRRGHALTGAPIAFERKALNRGTVVGSVLFGIGWSLAGMCPGPILVNLFGLLYPRLQRPFGLPPLGSPSTEHRTE